MLQLISGRFIQLAALLLTLSLTNCKKTDTSNTSNTAKITTVYRFDGEMNVDGRTRSYLLNLPPHYNDSSKLSLVIVLHGYGGSASQAENDYQITDKANAEEFIVVYPEGIESNGPAHLRSWNAGNCCPVASTIHVDDVHFISLLIDTLIANYKVNAKKVYVAGISNGAMMAYTLACDLSNKIAAITSVSGTLMKSSPCRPMRAVPILHMHSAVDLTVPYNGGIGMGGFYFTPVDSTMAVWTALNSCVTPPSVTNYAGYTFTEWKDQTGRPAIDLYLTQDGGHSWPGGLKPRPQADPPSTVINANDLLWNFFQRYTLP